MKAQLDRTDCHSVVSSGLHLQEALSKPDLLSKKLPEDLGAVKYTHQDRCLLGRTCLTCCKDRAVWLASATTLEGHAIVPMVAVGMWLPARQAVKLHTMS